MFNHYNRSFMFPPAAVQRHEQSACQPDQVTPDLLVEMLKRSAGAQDAVLDQHYRVTAVMLERATAHGHRRPILVELLHEPAAPRPRRWMAMAFDELTQRQAGPIYAETSERAIREIPWYELEPIASPNGPDAPIEHPGPTPKF